MISLGFLPSIGIWELVIILVIILLIFGPGKLPEVGKAIGKSLRSFKDAQKSVEKDIANAVKDTEDPPPVDNAFEIKEKPE